MKAIVRTSLAQSVNLTPQLLQSIRLLQLTAPELELELRQTLERNPLLEHDESADEVEEADDSDAEAIAFDTASWDELPEAAFLSGGSSTGGDGDDATARIAGQESSDPRVRLLELLALGWNDQDLALASWWLDRCDDRGYLEQPLAELATLGALAFPRQSAELESVRQRLLHGDWPGMAAGDVGECLLAQLAKQPESSARTLAKRILKAHVDLLAAHDDAALATALQADLAQVRAAVSLILSLRAHPVEAPAGVEDAHIIPDVVAWYAGGAWRVALNRRTTPSLRVSPHCERALSSGPASGDAVLRGLLDEARWLVRGLAMRNDTLLRTAQALVERQRGFLERGDEEIVPLTLREIADEIGMHESSVSRITTGKYIQTPRGTIELKRLFAVRLEGAEVGGIAVRAMVKRLIDAEPVSAPLGDDVIVGMLARQGVSVARRTVAKYRDQLKIGPARSRQRSSARAMAC